MVANGVYDLLISNQIVGPIKTRRLAAVNAQPGVDVKVCVDNLDNVREIGAAATALGSRVRVLIELNTGMNRAGIEPADALEFAKVIAATDGVEFAGLMTWEGHTMGVKIRPNGWRLSRARCNWCSMPPRRFAPRASRLRSFHAAAPAPT